MDENKITIGFTLIDEMGDEYSASSTCQVFEELDETALDVIGTQLNSFLKQAGYVRKNDNILMESLSDEEYDAVTEFLIKYREDNKNVNNT